MKTKVIDPRKHFEVDKVIKAPNSGRNSSSLSDAIINKMVEKIGDMNYSNYETTPLLNYQRGLSLCDSSSEISKVTNSNASPVLKKYHGVNVKETPLEKFVKYLGKKKVRKEMFFEKPKFKLQETMSLFEDNTEK